MVGLVFVVLLVRYWSSGMAWRLALPAVGLVSVSTFYLSYLQATFRSGSDFALLTRVQWVQAAMGLLLPFLVSALGFAGLCLHGAAQSVVVTAYAHALRPLRVRPRFEPHLALQLLATGLPLFLATYLQTLALGFDRVILLQRGSVETVGYYAPALAVISAMAIVPGAVATYVIPRMSYALGQGKAAAGAEEDGAPGRGGFPRRRIAGRGRGLAAGAPVIERFFPQYVASIPAVRWSLFRASLERLAGGQRCSGA